jgi:hypothetical protein
VTILDICDELHLLDIDGVMYAQRVGGEFVPASLAVVVTVPPEEVDADTSEIAARNCPGFDYCLEIDIALDAVRVWSQWRGDAEPTPTQRAEAVCFKANFDAWGPPVVS